MATAVYVLCALTALACATLLLRSFRRTRSPLLLWASVCFVVLAANNVLLFVDLVMVPDTDLSLVRSAIALGGLSILLYGLVWSPADHAGHAARYTRHGGS